MPISVENALLTPGLPDLALTVGWCECKIESKWPVRSTTPLRVCWQPNQQQWAVRWTEHGGNYWLAVKVGKELLIFDCEGAQKVGTLTRAEMHEEATAHFLRWPTSEEICPFFELG